MSSLSLASMRIVFDTSILVAAAVAVHPRHAEAVALLSGLEDGEHEGFFSTHALAELYSVLTKLPLEPRISPNDVLALKQALRGFLSVVPCNSKIYDVAMQRCAERGLTSGVIFDALHLCAAEEIRSDVLVTFNVRDFERLSASNSPRIVEKL